MPLIWLYHISSFLGRCRHNPNKLYPHGLGDGGQVSHCLRKGCRTPALLFPRITRAGTVVCGVRDPSAGGCAADTFGPECSKASWASPGGLLPPRVTLPHLFQGNKLVLRTGPQGQLLFIPDGMVGKNVSSSLWDLEGALVSGLRKGTFAGQICLSPTRCPKESPGAAPVSGHLQLL